MDKPVWLVEADRALAVGDPARAAAALAAVPAADRAVARWRGEWLRLHAIVLDLGKQHEEALVEFRRAAAAHEADGVRRFHALALHGEAIALGKLARTPEAIAPLARAAALIDPVADARDAGRILSRLGSVHLRLDDTVAAEAAYVRAQEVLDAAGAGREAVAMQALNGIGEACRRQGRFDAAEAAFVATLRRLAGVGPSLRDTEEGGELAVAWGSLAMIAVGRADATVGVPIEARLQYAFAIHVAPPRKRATLERNLGELAAHRALDLSADSIDLDLDGFDAEPVDDRTRFVLLLVDDRAGRGDVGHPWIGRHVFDLQEVEGDVPQVGAVVDARVTRQRGRTTIDRVRILH